MKEVLVAKACAVSSLGDSLEVMWPALCAGTSSAAPVTRFDTAALAAHLGAVVSGIAANADEDPVCCLAGRLLEGLGAVPPETVVIWCGIKGSAAQVERVCEGHSARGLYLPADYRRWVCDRMGLQDRGLEVNAACASSTVGLAIAARMVSSRQAGSVLVCAADALSRFIYTGFSALRALSPTVCRPFDSNRDGLLLGEGATAILLCDRATAHANGCEPLAALTGWGVSNDANHITGPARDGAGLIRAVRAALQRSRLATDDLEAICAHGTGTVFNDAMELTALESIFGGRRFPVFSIKGAVGHTMGAAGGLEASVAIQCLRERTVPATAGLVEVEERGAGRVSSGPQNFAGNNIITTNSGFGGCNAALIFERL